MAGFMQNQLDPTAMLLEARDIARMIIASRIDHNGIGASGNVSPVLTQDELLQTPLSLQGVQGWDELTNTEQLAACNTVISEVRGLIANTNIEWHYDLDKNRSTFSLTYQGMTL